MGVRQNHPGFTLVELLVVLGVIVILLGILLPAVNGARRAAGQAECASNLRQWAIAVVEYAQDNHQWLPRRGQGIMPTQTIDWYDDWFNELPPYLKQPTYNQLASSGKMPGLGSHSVWMCPDAGGVPNSFGYLFGYSMNMALSVRNDPQPDRIDRVGPASTMAFMADGAIDYCSTLPTQTPAAYNPVARHSGYVNVSFLDTHVQAFAAAYVASDWQYPGFNDLRWYWYQPGPARVRGRGRKLGSRNARASGTFAADGIGDRSRCGCIGSLSSVGAGDVFSSAGADEHRGGAVHGHDPGYDSTDRNAEHLGRAGRPGCKAHCRNIRMGRGM